MMTTCNLCGELALLQNSHVIPSFVFRWLKDTSATGFLRWPQNDKRLQDGYKDKLFCSKCEQRFSIYERQFASSIFYPFVNEELDHRGVPKGVLKEIPHDEWLLKFAVSIQWRTLFLMEEAILEFGKDKQEIIQGARSIWRSYLLDQRKDSGPWEFHLIFLFNFDGARGPILSRLPENINTYILRSIDTTIGSSRRKLAHYTKLGPIALWTCLTPESVKGMDTSRIRKRGPISVVQTLRDTSITEMIFFTRPREIGPVLEPNEKVQARVRKSFEKNPERAVKSMTFQATKSDYKIASKKARSPQATGSGSSKK